MKKLAPVSNFPYILEPAGSINCPRQRVAGTENRPHFSAVAMEYVCLLRPVERNSSVIECVFADFMSVFYTDGSICLLFILTTRASNVLTFCSMGLGRLDSGVLITSRV